ncbi:hypothetical protein OSTOST_25586, partial [Ostertagia ostertagi]
MLAVEPWIFQPKSSTYSFKEFAVSSNSESCNEEARKRAAWAAFGSIREVTDQVNDPELKASIFNASVLPAMCYATETWPNNKTIAKAMQTAHRALE